MITAAAAKVAKSPDPRSSSLSRICGSVGSIPGIWQKGSKEGGRNGMDDGDGGCRKNGGEIGGKTKAALMMPLHFRTILIRVRAARWLRGRHLWGNISFDSLAAPVQHSLLSFPLSENKQLCHRGNEECASASVRVRCPYSRGSFSLATPLIGISQLESAPATGANANGTFRPLPIQPLMFELQSCPPIVIICV